MEELQGRLFIGIAKTVNDELTTVNCELLFYCLPNRYTNPYVKPTLFCMVDPKPVA